MFQVAVKQGNLILAIVMDIILGYIALQWLSQDKRDISIGLMGVLEVIKYENNIYLLFKVSISYIISMVLLHNSYMTFLLKYYFSLLQKLINSLYSLLKWLMGAPVGLKLNNAFNKMLGKYFSYHVQLWWLFLGK